MPFDLDAAVAEAAEGKQSAPFEFTFDGVDYTLPAQPDIVTLNSMTSGNVIEAMTGLLGPDAWATVCASRKFTLPAFRILLDAYIKHAKVETGESGASTTSSETTAEQ